MKKIGSFILLLCLLFAFLKVKERKETETQLKIETKVRNHQAPLWKPFKRTMIIPKLDFDALKKFNKKPKQENFPKKSITINDFAKYAGNNVRTNDEIFQNNKQKMNRSLKSPFSPKLEIKKLKIQSIEEISTQLKQ